MATITPTTSEVRKGVSLTTWAGQTDADTATALEILGFTRGSVQFDGTYGGATIVLQGSNDGSNWATLDDEGSVAISSTAASVHAFNCNCRYVRPAVSGGTSESLNTRVLLLG